METTILRDLKIEHIQSSANNPRKSFNEQSLNELAESIKAQGVLQPIIVKDVDEVNNPHAFEIICGERRFRAAQMAGLQTIPAIVRFATTKDQYFEMALTENLLREDISSIEEMAVYTQLIEQSDYTIERLMERFAKSESYIRSRIHLVNLIEEYHPLMQCDDVSLTVALELCKFSKETQAEIYDNHYADDVNWQNWRGGKAKDIIDTLQKSYSSNLEDYFFDKESCYSCHFNTQVISLFTEDSLCGRCTNRTCLKAKNTAYIVDRAIKTHEQNPELPLARGEYRNDDDAVEQLTAKGYEIKIIDWCSECPTPPVADDYETDEEYQAELADFVEQTSELTEKYQKGEIEMFAFVGNRGVSLSYRRVDAGANSATTAETPLVKLQNQDKRNKEIAIEKSIADTKELVKGLDVTQGEFSALEEQITYFAMAKALRRENFGKVGIEDKYYLTDEDRWTLVYNLTEERKTIIKRDFILSTLSDAQRGNYTAVMLFGYAEQHAEEQVKEIQATHDAVYEKRHARIEEKRRCIERAEPNAV